MENVINLTDYKVKKILGSMSDIVLDDKKRNRILNDIKKCKQEYSDRETLKRALDDVMGNK